VLEAQLTILANPQRCSGQILSGPKWLQTFYEI
jgi:hypothetical protein